MHDQVFTIVFVDTRLWKTKHPRKRFQNFRQSYVLSTDWIEIHQSQPLVWPSDLPYVMLAGCDWWILIRHVDNKWDWRKFWKHFRGCFVFQSRVSRKTVVNSIIAPTLVLEIELNRHQSKVLPMIQKTEWTNSNTCEHSCARSPICSYTSVFT